MYASEAMAAAMEVCGGGEEKVRVTSCMRQKLAAAREVADAKKR